VPRNRAILDRQILPGTINRVVATTYRGKFVMRAWPKPAGAATAPPLIESQRVFRECQKLIKRVTGDAMNDAITQAKGTGLYPRDVLMSAMTVGLYDIADPEGWLITNAVYYLRPKVFQGAIIRRNTNQSIAALTETPVTWNDPQLQTVPILNAGTPSRLVVPTGVTVVNITAKIRSTGVINGTHQVLIRNQAGIMQASQQETSNARVSLTCQTGPIVVSPGNWFDVRVFFGAAGSVEGQPGTGVTMELLQVAI